MAAHACVEPAFHRTDVRELLAVAHAEGTETLRQREAGEV